MREDHPPPPALDSTGSVRRTHPVQRRAPRRRCFCRWVAIGKCHRCSSEAGVSPATRLAPPFAPGACVSSLADDVSTLSECQGQVALCDPLLLLRLLDHRVDRLLSVALAAAGNATGPVAEAKTRQDSRRTSKGVVNPIGPRDFFLSRTSSTESLDACRPARKRPPVCSWCSSAILLGGRDRPAFARAGLRGIVPEAINAGCRQVVQMHSVPGIDSLQPRTVPPIRQARI